MLSSLYTSSCIFLVPPFPFCSLTPTPPLPSIILLLLELRFDASHWCWFSFVLDVVFPYPPSCIEDVAVSCVNVAILPITFMNWNLPPPPQPPCADAVFLIPHPMYWYSTAMCWCCPHPSMPCVTVDVVPLPLFHASVLLLYANCSMSCSPYFQLWAVQRLSGHRPLSPFLSKLQSAEVPLSWFFFFFFF